MLYSPSTGGFYRRDIHGDRVPADVVEISAERHGELVDARSEGAAIETGEDGLPIIRWPAPPSLEEHRERAIAAAKNEAHRRITAAVPMWRQSNDNALIALAAVELNAGSTVRDFVPALERRERIDAIRAASDALEAAIGAMGEAQLAALDVADDAHWPI